MYTFNIQPTADIRGIGRKSRVKRTGHKRQMSWIARNFQLTDFSLTKPVSYNVLGFIFRTSAAGSARLNSYTLSRIKLSFEIAETR